MCIRDRRRSTRNTETSIANIFSAFLLGNLRANRYNCEERPELNGSPSRIKTWVDIEIEPAGGTVNAERFLLYSDSQLLFEYNGTRNTAPGGGNSPEYMCVCFGEEGSRANIIPGSSLIKTTLVGRVNTCLATLQWYGLLEENLRVLKPMPSRPMSEIGLMSSAPDWVLAGLTVGLNGLRSIEFEFDKTGYAEITYAEPWQ